MADITDYLADIRTAQYGKEVREAIASGIEQCYEDGKAGAVDLTARSSVAALTPRVTAAESDIDELEADLAALTSAVGSPLVATTAAGMTDTTKVYVYTGSETGYTNGDWYYYDGNAWQDGGVYNSVAVQTDTTLAVSGAAADAAAVGTEVDTLKSDIDWLYGGYESVDTLGVTWANGGLSNGALTTTNYRVSMTAVYVATQDLFVKIAGGFKIGVHRFSNASTFAFDYGWRTSLVRIDAGTIFKIVVARVSENTSEIADIAEFTGALKIYTDVGEFTLNRSDELVLKLSQDTARESMTFTEVDASDITLVTDKLIHKNNLVGGPFGDQTVSASAYFYTDCSGGDVFEIGFRSRDADRYHIAFTDSDGIILDAQVRGSGANYVYTGYIATAPIGSARLYVASTSNTVPNAGGINTLKKGSYDVAKASVMGNFFIKGDHYYIGDRIDLTAKHGYTFENIGAVADYFTPSVTFISKVPQGMGVYNGKAVCFLKYGGIFVWDLESKSVELELAASFLSTAHCNSVSFGDFYDASDDFPLIYLSECLNATSSRCFVIRLTGGAATLIQTITYSNNNAAYTGSFDWIVDTDNGLISTFGNSSNGTHTICSFGLPSFSNGDTTLTASDIIDSWIVEDGMGSYGINVYQGHLLYNGMLFLPDGAWGNNTIFVFDMYAHTLRNVIPCGWRDNEFEDVDIYDGKLIVFSGSTDYGRFDAITFKA